jgi:hypothetical protein
MLRVFVLTATFALAAPTILVAAEEPHRPTPGKPVGRPVGPLPGVVRPGAPAVVRPGGPAVVRPGLPVVGPVGPRVGGPVVVGPRAVGPQFSYRGRMINRVRLAPFAYPPGWGYRRWVIGAALPAIFLTAAYFYTDWAAIGLEPPPPGYQWVRYGPDLLLVDVNTGMVADAAYGVAY